MLPSTCKIVFHSPLMTVLIATFSQLHSNRPPLPDVPAVYFVSPNLANVRRIAEDLEKGLYESYHLNFVEPLQRALLEELAAVVARDGTGELVEQVCQKCCSHCPRPTNACAHSRSWTNTYLSLHLRRRCSPSFPRQMLHLPHNLMLRAPPQHPSHIPLIPSSILHRQLSNR